MGITSSQSSKRVQAMLFWQVSPGPSSGRLTGKSSIGSLAGGCTMERLYITIFLLKQIQPLQHRCCKKRLHPDNDSRPCLGSPELVHYMLDTPQAWPIQYFYSSVDAIFHSAHFYQLKKLHLYAIVVQC